MYRTIGHNVNKITTYADLVAQVEFLGTMVMLQADYDHNKERNRELRDEITRLQTVNAAIQDDINRKRWTMAVRASRMTTTTEVHV